MNNLSRRTSYQNYWGLRHIQNDYDKNEFLLDYCIKNDAQRHTRPLYVNLGGVINIGFNIGLNIGLNIVFNIGFQYYLYFKPRV